jgi:hypothetical protein
MLTAAVRVPLAEGLNVTKMSQLPPAATDVPQLFVIAKSRLSVPVIPIDVIVKVPLPVFFRVETRLVLVMLTAWLPKVRLERESLRVACQYQKAQRSVGCHRRYR